MCGFVTIFDPSLNKLINAKDLVDKMCEQIIHRGPNHYGYYEESGIAMGHRRLSIIDLSDSANQPLTKNGYTVAFNGEIYNYLEIRSELEQKFNTHFSTASDTEVLLEAYIHFGPECVKKFNGMFSFTIWDEKNKLLFICRDRLGVKPLYYLLNNNIYYFASDIKSLWEIISPIENISHEALVSFFSYSYINTQETITKKINKFPPAHYCIIQNGQEQYHEYWNLNNCKTYASDLSFKEATKETQNLLDDAISLRLRSDVPLGCFLSGGVDSSLITAIASQQINHPIHTYSIGFDDPAYDESCYAQRVSAKYKTIHHHVNLEAECLEDLPQIIWHYAAPFGDASAIPTFFVSKTAKKNLTVVLTGDGADEAFGGYVDAFAVYINQKYQRIPPIMRDKINYFITKMPQFGALSRWGKRFTEISNKNIEELYLDLKQGSFLPYQTCFKNLIFNPENFSKSYIKACLNTNPVNKLLYADIKDRLEHDFLVKVDMGTMAHSIEARSPFLDYRLIEWGYSLPHKIRYKNFTRKAVLKKVAEKYIDKDILYRKKMGFSIPQFEWLSEKKWFPVIEKIINRSTILYQFLDKNITSQIVNNFKNGNTSDANRIWLLLWFQIWEGLFISKIYQPNQKLSNLV